MSSEDFAKKVAAQFCLELTDQLFMYIENDKNLMQDYLRLVSEEGLFKANQNLGSNFKKLFNVDNIEEDNNPNSKLIKSYTQHTLPRK